MKKIFIYATCWRFILHWIYFKTARNKNIISADLKRNSKQFMGGNESDDFFALCYLMTFYTMFRNIFYARVGKYHHFYAKFLGFFAVSQNFLDISETSEIGGGLFVQHGYNTIISPAKMGNNCWINQGVSIGHRTEVGTTGDWRQCENCCRRFSAWCFEDRKRGNCCSWCSGDA